MFLPFVQEPEPTLMSHCCIIVFVYPAVKTIKLIWQFCSVISNLVSVLVEQAPSVTDECGVLLQL